LAYPHELFGSACGPPRCHEYTRIWAFQWSTPIFCSSTAIKYVGLIEKPKWNEYSYQIKA